MKKIFPLPQNVISKIAAGEVIERPVYAVKELIENSLDAGADTITILVEESGLRKIAVIDNGEGMSLEDVKECFKPHSTSKISSEEELSHIHTLGFRGEALSSIASISRLIIKSKRAEDTTGTQIELHEGKIEKISPIGMPHGTEIVIEGLFGPVPARKKFLKSSRTEFRHTIELIISVALSYPNVHFSLSHNGKMIFDLPKPTPTLPYQGGSKRSSPPEKGELEEVFERINMLLGRDIFSNLLPVSYEDSYIKISGFLGKPQIAKGIASKQYIYINNRKVTNKQIAFAVKEAYGTLLQSGKYPVFLLFVSLPFEAVDVNVHPRKEEVRFINNQLIAEAVHGAVAKTLTENNLTFNNYWKHDLFPDEYSLKDAPLSLPNTHSYAGRILKEDKFPWSLQTIIEVSPTTDIIQLHNLYLALPTQHGMLLVDQHAAHERILYEQLLESFKDKKKELALYKFSKPHVFELDFVESELLQENVAFFAEMGFAIEHFKANSFLLHALPLLLHDRNAKQLISEMLENISQEKKAKDLDEISRKTIAYIACRGAVKRGDKLTKKQARDLLEKLEQTSNNATCPHGRPVKVEISLDKLHKLFKR